MSLNPSCTQCDIDEKSRAGEKDIARHFGGNEGEKDHWNYEPNEQEPIVPISFFEANPTEKE